MRTCFAFLTSTLILLIASGASAQTFTDRHEEGIPASELTLDLESLPQAYAGTYHFGDSEWESTLKLTVRGSGVTGVLTYSVWNNAANNWKQKTIRFTGTITANLLIAKDWKGVFVRRGDRRGLLLIEAGRDQNVREFGYRM